MRFIVILAVIFLSGCSFLSHQEAAFACPRTGLLADAAALTRLAADGKTKGVEARIAAFSGHCRFEKGEVLLELTVPFVARRGPAGAGLKNQTLPYFIAILSPEEEILERQAFSTTINFDNNDIGSSSEEHVLRIPLQDPALAYKYKVAIGFVLPPASRQHKDQDTP